MLGGAQSGVSEGNSTRCECGNWVEFPTAVIEGGHLNYFGTDTSAPFIWASVKDLEEQLRNADSSSVLISVLKEFSESDAVPEAVRAIAKTLYGHVTDKNGSTKTVLAILALQVFLMARGGCSDATESSTERSGAEAHLHLHFTEPGMLPTNKEQTEVFDWIRHQSRLLEDD